MRVSLPRLEDDTGYHLELPAGTHVTNISGPTAAVLRLPLHGLRPFTFMWLPSTSTQIGARHEKLFVRHGLPSSTDLGSLAASIDLSTGAASRHAIQLERVSATELRLSSQQFAPGSTDYIFSVAANTAITDGLGASLQPSIGNFSAALQRPFAGIAASFALASPANAQTLVALARGIAVETTDRSRCRGVTMTAATVGRASMAEALQQQVCSRTYTFFPGCFNSSLFSGTGTEVHGPQKQSKDLEQWQFSSSLFEASGAVMVQSKVVRAAWEPDCDNTSYDGHPIRNTYNLYTRAPFATTAVAFAGDLNVWVTDLLTAHGVEGAEVVIYAVSSDYTKGVQVAQTSTALTDANGLASVLASEIHPKDDAFCRYGCQYKAVVWHSGAVGLTDFSLPYRNQPSTTFADLITDRALFRVGDTIFLKGFVRQLDATGAPLPAPLVAKDHYTLTLGTPWGNANCTYQREFGTISGNITVPPHAVYGLHSLTLNLNPPRDNDNRQA
eukprot:COSAG01_NODE_4509_length_4967_cov_2.290058_4_plen_499_part_01